MSWGTEARQKIFDLYNQGQQERTIVTALRHEFGIDDKTVRRCVSGLDLIELTRENAGGIKDRFERLGGTEHYLQELRRTYSAFKRPRMRGGSDGRTKEHWQELMAPLTDLLGAGPLVVHAYDLATFYSRPHELSWPVAKGHVRRKPNGGLTVLLDTEGKLQWTYLHQHLENDPIWTAIETWKSAMAEDVSARLAMLGVVIKQIEMPADQGGLGWPVVPETGPTFVRIAQERARAVSLYYAFRLYDQAFSRSLDLRHQRYERKDFMSYAGDAVDTVDLGGNPVIFALEAVEREEAIRFFLQKQAELLVLPVVKSAVDAYRRGEWATEQVKTHLERLYLALGFPPGSACDVCQDWATYYGTGIP